MQNAYSYPLKSITGQPIDLAIYKGKKILLVNTASACGYTPQYQQLEELYENYKDKLVVIGLPCNDFGAQEPGTEQEIQEFCMVNFGVSFPLTSKIKILAPGTDPLYQYLTKKELNGYADSEVRWNFQKYLIDETGQLIGMFAHSTDPLSEEVLKAIES